MVQMKRTQVVEFISPENQFASNLSYFAYDIFLAQPSLQTLKASAKLVFISNIIAI